MIVHGRAGADHRAIAESYAPAQNCACRYPAVFAEHAIMADIDHIPDLGSGTDSGVFKDATHDDTAGADGNAIFDDDIAEMWIPHGRPILFPLNRQSRRTERAVRTDHAVLPDRDAGSDERPGSNAAPVADPRAGLNNRAGMN